MYGRKLADHLEISDILENPSKLITISNDYLILLFSKLEEIVTN